MCICLLGNPIKKTNVKKCSNAKLSFREIANTFIGLLSHGSDKLRIANNYIKNGKSKIKIDDRIKRTLQRFQTSFVYK